MTQTTRLYRIKLSVAVYKDKKLSYKNEMIVPTFYSRRSEARNHIKTEIQDRLRHSAYFISPRADYDLVRYTNEASCNTYLRYRIVEQSNLEADAANPVRSDVNDTEVMEARELID